MKRGHIGKAERRARGEIRQSERDERDNEKQIATLNQRLGNNKGAKKERKRLSKVN